MWKVFRVNQYVPFKRTFLAHKIASKEILTNLEQTEWAELVPKIGERAAIRLAISKLV